MAIYDKNHSDGNKGISRREFMKISAAVSLAGVGIVKTCFGSQGLKQVAPDVFMYTDSCNSYCIRSGDEAILIDCGQGGIKNHLSEIGVKKIRWILHTHAHRDLCQADNLFTATGTDVAVPAGTKQYFADSNKHWYNRQTYIAGMRGPRYFMPLRSTPVKLTLKDGAAFEWKDISLKVLDTPGHTATHVSFVMAREGKKYIFSGDIIHSPGRVWEMDAMESVYEEFVKDEKHRAIRVTQLLASIELLRKQKPDMLLPAHGEPFGDCDEGLRQLDENIKGMKEALKDTAFDPWQATVLPEVKEYQTGCCQYLLEAEDGHAILFDASFVEGPYDRNLIEWFKQQPTLKKVDIVIPSHYHGDHIATIRAFADKYDSKVYVHEILKDILSEPHRFFLPAMYYYPIKIDRAFKEGESFEWHGWKLTFYHFPGQTYWHQATLIEKNGKKILFTGDSIDGFRHIRCIDTWNYNPISDTEGAIKCVELLEKLNPDYVATGHWSIQPWKPEYVEGMRQYIKNRNEALRKITAQENPDMSYDVHWARLEPFRTIVKDKFTISLSAKIRNHLVTTGDVRLRLTIPKGWQVQPQTIASSIKPRSEGSFNFTVKVPKNAEQTRHVIGLDVTLNNRKYGELGMCVVDVGKRHDIEWREPEKFRAMGERYGFFSK